MVKAHGLLWSTFKAWAWRFLPLDGFLLRKYRSFGNWRYYVHWRKHGGKIPDLVRQAMVRAYAEHFQLRIFIETGTYLGDMTAAVKDSFDLVYSIELSSEFYENAKKRFKRDRNVKVVHGDSSIMLPKILREIHEPALFWLDAHFIPNIPAWRHLPVARGEQDTPIVQELEVILQHPIKDHLILIDDADFFVGRDGYPTLSELEGLMKHKARIQHNVILLNLEKWAQSKSRANH